MKKALKFLFATVAIGYVMTGTMAYDTPVNPEKLQAAGVTWYAEVDAED